MQELIDAWYVHGIYTLWLAPLGLGMLYYLIPKMSGLEHPVGLVRATRFLDVDHLRAVDRRA